MTETKMSSYLCVIWGARVFIVMYNFLFWNLLCGCFRTCLFQTMGVKQLYFFGILAFQLQLEGELLEVFNLPEAQRLGDIFRHLISLSLGPIRGLFKFLKCDNSQILEVVPNNLHFYGSKHTSSKITGTHCVYIL